MCPHHICDVEGEWDNCELVSWSVKVVCEVGILLYSSDISLCSIPRGKREQKKRVVELSI